MCLDSVTKKPKKHEVGYKLFQNLGDHFKSPVFATNSYHIGKTYDAKFGEKELRVMDTMLKGETYKAGFHYYLKRKDAKKLCNDDQVVIRIKVKNILATGTQFPHEAGVSEFITLDRVIFDGAKAKTQIEKANFQKFLNICKEKVSQKILQFSKQLLNSSRIIPESCMEKFINFITKTDDNFVNYVLFIDTFPRQSNCFKLLTKVHLWASNNHKEYKRYFHLTVKDEDMKARVSRTDYLFMKQFTNDIDNFVLNN